MSYFVAIAGRRWPVETTFKTGKDAFGWDQSQVRTWDALHRHTLLTAPAQIRAIALRDAMTSGNENGRPRPPRNPRPRLAPETTAPPSPTGGHTPRPARPRSTGSRPAVRPGRPARGYCARRSAGR